MNLSLSASALSQERPGAQLQAGGYDDSAMRPAVPGTFPGARSGAVSWTAVAAGAAAAASPSLVLLILLILGVGLGLSSVSPWAGAGIGAGGYLAGRLRRQWSDSLRTR